jgi:hypothetical protein
MKRCRIDVYVGPHDRAAKDLTLACHSVIIILRKTLRLKLVQQELDTSQ